MIEVRNVTGGYGDRDVVRGINFTIQKGEFFAILGPNGSGKSTLLKIMTGMLPSRQGDVCLSGCPLAHYTTVDLARQVAVLGQEEKVAFDFTVEEIVALGRYPHQRGWMKMLSRRDLDVMEEAMRLTQVLHYRETPLRALSGGEKQRVLLAKALVQEPQVLVLDEPTNHLDLQHTFHILNLLKEWQAQRELTVVAVLHDLNVAALYADRVLLLKDGEVWQIGDVQLMKKESGLRHIYDVQVTARDHPHLAKPQVLLTPDGSAEAPGADFADLYKVDRAADCVLTSFARPLKCVSNGVWGGGFQWARHFCNFHVPKQYDCRDPAGDIHRWLQQRDLPEEQSVGMMTAVDLSDAVVLEREQQGYAFLTVVTAGVGNAVDIAGESTPETMYRIGTINTFLFVQAHLTESAFVNAFMSATEAKTKALHDHGIRDPLTGTLATGTSTDSLLIGATQQGEPELYAGSGTALGKGIGQVVYEATRQAIRRYERRMARSNREKRTEPTKVEQHAEHKTEQNRVEHQTEHRAEYQAEHQAKPEYQAEHRVKPEYQAEQKRVEQKR
jgi:iron complex transport system ATP-binding protein